MNLKQMNEMVVILNAVTAEGGSGQQYALGVAGYGRYKEGKFVVERDRLIADLKKDKFMLHNKKGVGRVTRTAIFKYLLETV